MKVNLSLLVIPLLLLCAADRAFAAPEIGRVVALRGEAAIERGGESITAQVKSGLQASDVVATAAASKAKILFVDDSVITLAEKTRFSVKEFIDGKGERGKSVFNLLDGKMRSVVGRTEFSVETPTAVAAARGTVIFFEVGSEAGRPFTSIVCLEGVVEVRSRFTEVMSQALLTPGTMVIVRSGEGVPQPTRAPANVLEQTRQSTSSGEGEEGGDDSGESGGDGENQGENQNGEGDSAGGDGGGGDLSGGSDGSSDSSGSGDSRGLGGTDSFGTGGSDTGGSTPPILQEPLTEQRRPTRVEVDIVIPGQ